MKGRCALFLLAVGLATSAYAADPQKAKPKGNPGDWIQIQDYPPAALRALASGITAFRLNIDETGRVDGCAVVQSSGNASLDTATCALITARASFTPPTDDAGKRIASTYSNRVKWQIPEGGPIPIAGDAWVTEDDYPPAAIRAEHEGDVAIRLDLDATGGVTACQILTSSGYTELDQASCRLLRARARFVPARNAEGQAITSEFLTHVNWKLDADARPGFGGIVLSLADYPLSALEYHVHASVGFDARIDEKGRVSSCRLTQKSGTHDIDAATCPIVISRARFLPAHDASGNAVASEQQGHIDW